MTGIHYGLVFVGGGLGAMARLYVSGAVARFAGTAFPWGTLAVNMVGALAIGLIVEFLALKFSVSPGVRLFWVTGVLGGFTTFSAFSLETYALLEKGAYGLAGAYVAASVGGTLIAVAVGIFLVRLVMG